MAKKIIEVFYADMNEHPFDYQTLKLIGKQFLNNGVSAHFTEDRIHMEANRMEILVSSVCYLGIQFGIRRAAILHAEREKGGEK